MSPSVDNGAGIGPPERAVGGMAIAVGWSGSGVSMGAAVEIVSGVAACNVANRSGVGVEAGRLHPRMTNRMMNVKKRVRLFVFQFDRFKVELLACQNFCTITSAIGTVDLFIEGMIFLETSHALHLCFYKTEVKPGLFRKCTLAECIPVLLDGCISKIGDLTQNQIHILYGM